MSTIELAVSKVKTLSDRQALELLGWLAARPAKRAARPARTPARKTTTRRSARKLLAWYDSIRGTTDWQPPRMPRDLVKTVSL